MGGVSVSDFDTGRDDRDQLIILGSQVHLSSRSSRRTLFLAYALITNTHATRFLVSDPFCQLYCSRHKAHKHTLQMHARTCDAPARYMFE